MPVCENCVCVCFFTEGQLCSPILTNPPGTSHIPSPKHHYSHTQTLKRPAHISLSPYCQDCVYVEADNTTGLNPSTCDFLQTGLVPVSPLNSPWNTGKSRAAGWSTGRGPNPLFHVLNTLLLLSKLTALLWMWSTSIRHSHTFQRAAMWTEKQSWIHAWAGSIHQWVSSTEEKHAIPVTFHTHRENINTQNHQIDRWNMIFVMQQWAHTEEWQAVYINLTSIMCFNVGERGLEIGGT